MAHDDLSRQLRNAGLTQRQTAAALRVLAEMLAEDEQRERQADAAYRAHKPAEATATGAPADIGEPDMSEFSSPAEPEAAAQAEADHTQGLAPESP